MTKLLYIEASPRKSRSTSCEIGAAFVDAYLDKNPTHEVHTINVWHHDLPELSGEMIKAVYSSIFALELNKKEHEEWKQIKRFANEFKDADKYVISNPMWNFGIPYKLKHYFDVIIQPGLTYQFTPPHSYRGLVMGKPVTVISARGGEYVRDAQKLDMQQPYLEQVLRFLGFQEIHHILLQPTLDSSVFSTQEAVKSAREEAIRQAQAIAANF